MTDLLTALLATCDARGDAPALRADSARLTYRGLGARIRATAAGLRAAGLADGDRVLFSVRPEPAGVVLALGIVAAGGTVVFADPGAGPELFAARLAHTAPRWAAAESLLYGVSAWRATRSLARRRGVLLPAYDRLPVRHVYAGRWLPGVPRGALSAARLARFPGMSAVDDAADREALIVFTSGTSAAPRAVVHTRGSLGAGLSVLAGRCALGPHDVVHTDQLMLGLPALVAGALWTMPPYGLAPAADPVRYAAGLTGVSHTFCVPADFAAVLDAIDAGRVAAPAGLRHVLLGGAPVGPPLLRRARQVLPGTEILSVYGMTEILPVATATAEDKLAHRGPGDLAGAPLPGVRARLADDGELLVRGPNLCSGYLGEPPMTEHATGDLARLDGDRIVLIGRKKDMIIRGRVNIYPGLYEPAIARLDGVAQAVLVGLPGPFGDERVALAVVPSDPEDAAGSPERLAAAVRAALPGVLDAGALPDAVYVVPAIPVAGRTSKPDRDALRTLLEARCASR
ncbi:class I adenylate-forming enzyme family protein [Dactylosporangium sp. NPDC000244]|uniref:class I adenylate-forming enzyme family protein n=1 Tax=Dactylosporangium sp. NPDC000244 TaxID=3154365 RepID=UPI0033301ADF